MIKIVDYGMGNLRSVQKAFEKLGADAQVVSSIRRNWPMPRNWCFPASAPFATRSPSCGGRGSTSRFANTLPPTAVPGYLLGAATALRRELRRRPVGGTRRLPGKVVRFADQPDLEDSAHGLELARVRQAAADSSKASPEGSSVYFVHSYHVVPDDESVVAARSEHGTLFASAVARAISLPRSFTRRRARAWACKLLKNFAKLNADTHSMEIHSRHRPSRRQMRAAAAGRLQARDDFQQTRWRCRPPIGLPRGRRGCTWSTSTGRAPGKPVNHEVDALDRQGGGSSLPGGGGIRDEAAIRLLLESSASSG